jgi:hypothetical protein
MIEEQKKNLKRSAVQVVFHKYGGIYHVTENGEILINIKQVDIWMDNGRVQTFERKSFIVDNYDKIIYKDYDKMKYLPGNIEIIEQLEPPIPHDPEYGLQWNEDHTQVLRDKESNVVYKYPIYNPSSEWKQVGNIDYFLK